MFINHYAFGTITIDNKSYNHDVILYPDHIQSDWWRDQGHLLQVQDIEEIIKQKPRKLIIGTGASGCMGIDEKVQERLHKEDIELVADITSRAVELFNEEQNKEQVIAAFHLTC